MLTPHTFKDLHPKEAEFFRDLRSFDNEDTSIDATITSFRWVLDNGEGRAPEDAYKDRWLHNIDDADSESDTVSLYVDSSATEGSQDSGNGVGNYIECKAWVGQASSAIGGKDADSSSGIYECQRLSRPGEACGKVSGEQQQLLPFSLIRTPI